MTPKEPGGPGRMPGRAVPQLFIIINFGSWIQAAIKVFKASRATFDSIAAA